MGRKLINPPLFPPVSILSFFLIFVILFFSTEESWVNKNDLTDVLVQVRISGTFAIVYDYYDFLNDIPDESVFQVTSQSYILFIFFSMKLTDEKRIGER